MAIRKSQVLGLSQMNKVLQEFAPNIQRRVLQNAVSAGGRVSMNAIKAKAPRHEGPQSPASKKYGTVVKNLSMRAMSKLRTTARGVRIWTKDAFWAQFYELGTSRQPARPFMRPGFDESETEAINAIAGKLYAGIESEAAKAAGYAGVKRG